LPLLFGPLLFLFGPLLSCSAAAVPVGLLVRLFSPLVLLFGCCCACSARWCSCSARCVPARLVAVPARRCRSCSARCRSAESADFPVPAASESNGPLHRKSATSVVLPQINALPQA